MNAEIARICGISVAAVRKLAAAGSGGAELGHDAADVDGAPGAGPDP